MCGDATSKEDIEKLMAGKSADLVFTDPPFDLNDLSFFDLIPIHEKTQLFIIHSDKNSSLLACKHKEIFNHFFIIDKRRNILISNNQPLSSHTTIGYFSKKNNFKNLYDGFSTLIKSHKQYDQSIKQEKRVELPFQFIIHYCAPGDIVVDLFGGSGSTLIACEQTGRTCYICELEPLHCDIILDRYVNFTGDNPIREADGVKWREVKKLQ